MNNSVCSNIMRDDQSTQNSSLNKITKEKYEKLNESLRKLGKKYNDQLFPQIWSSICRAPDPVYKELKWMRLSDIFGKKITTVWDSQSSVKINPGDFSRSYVQSTCFNAIKYNNFFL